MRLQLVMALMFALGGCGSNVEGGGDGGAGGSGGNGGAGGSGGNGGGSSVQCVGDMPMFPTFDKTCAMSTDCITVMHQVNCCGTRAAMGINSAEQKAFADAEATCEMQYPACGCAAMPTTTEDGKSATDETQIQVACMNGQCLTFLP